MQKKLANKRKALTVFSLVMLTIVSVDSVRNLPATALFGSSLIFFFIISALFFLIPCALISAELSSGYDEDGGVYLWVKEAFGIPIGFCAIWFQWLENVIWAPTILSFIAATIAYLIDPTLAANKYFLVAVILSVFWLATLVNIFGMRSSAIFSNFCSILGLVIPMTLIIALGAIWVLGHHHLQINFTITDMIPHATNSNMWLSLTAIMMSFCGIEIATVHAKDVANPQKSFPKALFYSTIFILLTLILGALAISVVLPHDDISLVAGIMQAFSAFFANYHIMWVVPIIALCLIIGGLGSLSNWIIAPVKGLLVAAEDGNLPQQLRKENRYRAPVNLLVYQAIIVSVLALAFIFMPTINSSYWLLTALAAQIYMFMYILMFLAAISLRYKYPLRKRSFVVPGGKIGLWTFSVMGILACIITVFVSFIPPANVYNGSFWSYEVMLLAAIFLMLLPPFFAYKFRKPAQEPSS